MTSNYCSHCGSQVIGAEDRCIQCGTKLRSGGWWSRLLGRLFGGSGRGPGSVIITSKEETAAAPGAELWLDARRDGSRATIKWESTDGRLPDDLPDDVRRRLQALRRSAAERGEGFEIRTSKTELYVVKDELGVERRYKSLDEMPPEVRQRIERATRELREEPGSNPQWPR